MERQSIIHNHNTQYETVIHILKQMQVDYRRATEHLQDMSSHFGQREATTREHLDLVLDAMNLMNTGRTSFLGLGMLQDSLEEILNTEAPVLCLQERKPVTTLEVRCLGSFQVRVGWREIEHWQTTKAKSLFKYLIAQRRRPLSRETLMETLWPGCDPQLANNNLRSAVRSLRQTLNPGSSSESDFAWVIFHDGNYMINPKVDIWMDTDQFEYHHACGLRFEKEDQIGQAIKEYEAGESLYRGDYLEEDWPLLCREALKDIHFFILGKLGDYSMRQGNHENAIAYSQKIISRDACREDAYRRLMRAHSRLGNRNRALQWYEICEKMIRAELDLSPDPRTQALYQRLLSNDAI